jgi:hypothetical protein
MKKLIILLLAAVFISGSAFSQKNPPEIVKNEFAKKYAAAKSVKWDNEEKTEWEAEFIMDGKKMSAAYDISGKWIESETAVTEKELPVSVVNTLNKDFQGYKKSEVVIFENSEMKGFEFGLKKGESKIEVVIDGNGKVIKKTESKEEDEKAEKPKK